MGTMTNFYRTMLTGYFQQNTRLEVDQYSLKLQTLIQCPSIAEILRPLYNFVKVKSVHFARLEQVRLGLFYFFVMLLTLFIIGGFWDEIDWKDLFFILLATVIIVGVIYLGRSCTENLTAGSDCVG